MVNSNSKSFKREGIFRGGSNHLEASLGPSKKVTDPISQPQMHREVDSVVKVKVHRELVLAILPWVR